MYHRLPHRRRQARDFSSIHIPTSPLVNRQRILLLLRRWWYPAILRHLRYNLARDDRGFLCDLLVCDGVALAAVLVRVAAGGDEEGEVEKSVGEYNVS